MAQVWGGGESSVKLEMCLEQLAIKSEALDVVRGTVFYGHVILCLIRNRNKR